MAKVTISVGIPQKLLQHIQENIKGKNRNDKVVKCAKVGYKLLTEE